MQEDPFKEQTHIHSKGLIASILSMPGVLELARHSEFIGYIHADPSVVVTGDETQYASVYSSEAVKGRRPAGWENHTDSYLYLAPENRLGYANRLPERSEALVFAQRGKTGGRPGWVAIAVFPVRYFPVSGGQVTATLGGGLYGSQSLRLSEMCLLLPRAIQGDAAAAKYLDPILSSVSHAVDALPRPLRHDVILAETKAIAARVERGTTRATVEKLFPQEDGGLSGTKSTRYWREPEVMVEVPYDQRGGSWKPTNRVTGPLRVYRSAFHHR